MHAYMLCPLLDDRAQCSEPNRLLNDRRLSKAPSDLPGPLVFRLKPSRSRQQRRSREYSDPAPYDRRIEAVFVKQGSGDWRSCEGRERRQEEAEADANADLMESLGRSDQRRRHERHISTLEEAEEDGDANEPRLRVRAEDREAEDSGPGAHNREKVERAKVVREEVGRNSPDDGCGVEDGEGVVLEGRAEMLLFGEHLSSGVNRLMRVGLLTCR